ncbi:MAG: DUF5107 domain-containing protein [Clostridia bacterium]|nr:DUF5107 domain-containing protein [Clostridia bacterium]
MLYFEKYIIRSATLGSENPLPDILNNSYIHAGFELTDAVTDEERKNLGKGMIRTLLPYTEQDGYDRQRNDRAFNAAILENRYLKAVFLPELGGRLWALTDKETGRELLYKNSVFQPCNLALRNAWFSGGVEFNVGIKGHTPLTCSPLFAERLTYAGGEEVLRMYEFERIREVVYSICAYLPEDSKVLYLKNAIENTSEQNKFTYWWSNIAVPEEKGLRIIVPTEESFLCRYDAGRYLLDKVSLPHCLDTDATYPDNLNRSYDFFYKIPRDRAKWIATANQDGNGLLQFSTNELIGRKLFVWGQGNGGRNWNCFLTEDDRPYVEIQAGLAHTQLEHLPMKAGERREFIEGYTSLNASPTDLHGDWQTAQHAVATHLQSLIGSNVDGNLRQIFPAGEPIQTELLTTGSGWGALENELRARQGKAPISHTITTWAHHDPDIQPWLYLLEKGEFPPYDPQNPPHSYVSNAVWKPLLEQAINGAAEQRWYAALQLGVLCYALADLDGAEKAFRLSIASQPNAWAYRNLARLLHKEQGNPEAALAEMRKALKLIQNCRGLYVETAQLLQELGQNEAWLTLFETMNKRLRSDGRLTLLKIVSLLRIGEIDRACALLTPDFKMDDIKEGELSVSQIWFDLYTEKLKKETGITDEQSLKALLNERYPLPINLDFRMHE